MRICLIDFAVRGDIGLLNAAMLFVLARRCNGNPIVGELVSPFSDAITQFTTPNRLVVVDLERAAWVLTNLSLEPDQLAPKLWADYKLVGVQTEYLKKNEKYLKPVARILNCQGRETIMTFDVTVIGEEKE